MAQKIITLCDMHLDRDEEVEGFTVPVTLDGKPRFIDLCPDDMQILVEPLRIAIEKHGRADTLGAPLGTKKTKRVTSAAKPSPTAMLQCPLCDHAPFAVRASFGKHVRSAHDLSLPELYERFDPNSLYIDRADVPAERLPMFNCPTCDRNFDSPQGLGAHRSRAHGYRAGDDSA